MAMPSDVALGFPHHKSGDPKKSSMPSEGRAAIREVGCVFLMRAFSCLLLSSFIRSGLVGDSLQDLCSCHFVKKHKPVLQHFLGDVGGIRPWAS